MPKIVLLLSLLLGTLHAAHDPIVRYAILAGVDLTYSRGDFDGKQSIRAEGKEVTEETIYLADIPYFMTYAVELRAYVDASTVAFHLALGYPEASYQNTTEDARLFRFGVEYQYHLFWPETWRPGFGAGYDFTSLRVPHAAHGDYGTSYATHSGSGFHAVASLGYYGWRNLGFEAALRYRLIGLGNVSTDANDFSELNKTMWQGLGELGIRTILVF